MKSLIAPGILIVLLLGLVHSQGQTLTFDLYFDKPVIGRTNSDLIISFENSVQSGKGGSPSVPFIPFRVVLPPGTVANSVVFTGMEPELISHDGRLASRGAARPISAGPSTVKSSAGATVCKREQSTPVKTGYLNGISIAHFVFTPIVLDSLQSGIWYYTRATVEISYGYGDASVSVLKGLNIRQARASGIESLVENPEMLRNYTQPQSRSQGYDYLIVTPGAFADDFDTLVEFYRQRGFYTRVVPVEHIDTASSGDDMQERIRTFVQSEYQDNGIRFLLLGGDVQLVPTRGFYCRVESPPNSGNYYTTADMPADLYYAGLDGATNWNGDGDTLWAEPGEADLYPEIAVGRFSFNNAYQLQKLLNKTILYQSQPVISDIQRPLLAGEYLYPNPLTYGAEYMELLVGTRSDNGYSTTGIPELHDVDSLYDRHSNWSKSDLINKVNQGVSAIHHCGHAGVTSVMNLQISDVTNTNFSQVDGINHQFPLVYSHGCNCGDFGKSDCIGETMAGIDNFACAFIGNSRYGWFVEGTSEGPAGHLHREFVDAIYNDTLHWIGSALKEARIMTAPWVDLPTEYEPGAFRWNFYCINILGDPLMSLWTYQPQPAGISCRTVLPIGADSLEAWVTSNSLPLKNAQCGIIQGDSLLGNACTDEQGRAVVYLSATLSEGPATLKVSGYNINTLEYDLCIADYWLGYSPDWSDPDNWYTGEVPDINTDIIIPSVPVGGFYPVENSSLSKNCRVLFLEPGVNLTIGPGETINISGSP